MKKTIIIKQDPHNSKDKEYICKNTEPILKAITISSSKNDLEPEAKNSSNFSNIE